MASEAIPPDIRCEKWPLERWFSKAETSSAIRSGGSHLPCSEYPSGQLDTSVQRMVAFIDVMKRLRMPVEWNAAPFRSEAFTRFFTTLSNVRFPPLSLLRGGHQVELVAGLAIVSLPSR